MICTDKSELQARLAAFGQEHVLDHWDTLNGAERARLAEQLASIDLDRIAKLWQESGNSETDWTGLAARGQTPPGIRLCDTSPRFSVGEARAAGEQALRAGTVAAILVAGGQGSRLGFPHPKGMYPIGPVSNRTLLEIFADQIIATTARYQTTLPLYLMTSPATHDETVAYFAENNNLGLPGDQLTIFCQGTMPAVDAETGQLLMAGKGELFESPDGHGGTLAALVKSGCLDEMLDQGIQHLFYFQVDNPLVRVADPVFLGYHILSKSEMTTQVIAKDDPLERVGNVVSVDGRLQIIEYSDLPDEAARRTNADGTLALWAGSIAVHAFDVMFLSRVRDDHDALPFHFARKQVPYLGTDGTRVEPSEPNAIKFERFIFDLLPLAQNAIVVEVDPGEGFAPLKNASGAAKDTPESTRAAISARCVSWLRDAGVTVADEVIVEIKPSFALDAFELKAKIAPGTEIAEPKYFC